MAGFDTVTFLSDYGLADEFVGLVKCVIRDLAPHVGVIDLTHDIAPHDVRAGSLALARSIQYVPSGVVLAVVDPGVGTERRALAIEVAGGAGILLGPDNGLLAPAVAMAGGPGRAVVLDRTELHLPTPGATFAGRDIFAPVAAHLCNGVSLEEVGELVDPSLLMPGVIPVPRNVEGGEGEAGMVAEVLWVDRFGNAQLNVGPDDVIGWGDVVGLGWGGERRTAKRVGTYDEIGSGAIGLVLDSYGLLAISVMRGSAAAELGLTAGDEVTLRSLDDGDARPGAGPGIGTVTRVVLRGPAGDRLSAE